MDISGNETLEPVTRVADQARAATARARKQRADSVKRSLRRVAWALAAVLLLSALAGALLALAQAALDAGLAGSAWDVVDLGR